MTEKYTGKTTEEYLEFYKDKPQEILIEVVSPCNLRCLGCPQALPEYRETKWKTPIMDFDLYISILEQTKALWPPVNVGLYHTGELSILPTEQFDRYVGTAKRILPTSEGWDSVGFYTNGLLLGPEKRRLIIQNGIDWVRLSFDGGDKESYEKVRVGSDFKVVYDNAIALANEVEAAGKSMRLEVIFVPYTENEETLEEFARLWRWSGWKAQTGGSMSYGGLMTEAVEKRRHKNQFPVRKRHAVPCPRVFEQFSVLVDGQVSLCSADPMGKFIFGDLNRESIKKIWQSDKRKETLRRFIEERQNVSSLPEICQNCDYTEFAAVPKGEYFGERHDS